MHHSRSVTRCPAARSGLAVVNVFLCLTALVGSGASVGCQRSLFKASDTRTQFDTTDQVRSKHVPLVEPDVFGNPQPALRARLGRRN